MDTVVTHSKRKNIPPQNMRMHTYVLYQKTNEDEGEKIRYKIGYKSSFLILMSLLREKGRARVHACKLRPHHSCCWN